MFQDPRNPSGGGLFDLFQNPQGMPGLLGGGMSPAHMGLLSGFAALAQAGAPSTQPKSFAGALGQGLMGGLQGYGMGQQFQALGEQNALRRAQMGEVQRKAKEAEEQRKRIEAFGMTLPEDQQPAFMANPNAYLDAFYKEKLQNPNVVVPAGGTVFNRATGLPAFSAPFKAPDDDDFARALKGAGIEPGSEQWKSLMKQRADRMVAPPSPLVQIGLGDKKVDEKFAGDFVEFVTGGYADVEKQISQLEDVAKQLEAKQGLTGPVVGAMPRHMMAVMNPKALAALESVEEVGQRNLRLILGPQFTEKEGERLISRVYNPMLSEDENLKRVRRLQKQMGDAAKAKLEAAKYFQEHGTLKGWRGKLWTIKDFNVEKDDSPRSPSVPAKGDVVDGWEFMGGDPSKQINWRKK